MMYRRLAYGAACFITVATAAEANAGLPMLAVAWPAFLFGLIPVIALEAVIFWIRGFPFFWSLKWNAVANAVTTLAGIPMTWLALLVVEFGIAIGFGILNLDPITVPAPVESILHILGFVFMAPWLGPFGRDENWIVPAAMLVLMVPFFVMSYWIESRILMARSASLDGDVEEKRVRRTCLIANAFTYALLALYPAWMFFTLAKD